MLSARTFDEVNNMTGFKRSEDFKKFFGSMDLSEPEKKKRIELAEKFEGNLLPVLALLFILQGYHDKDRMPWNQVEESFDKAYRDTLSGVMEIDDETDEHIKEFASDAVESTESHFEDPYYYSADRSRFMAENESATSWEHDDFKTALKAGKKYKTWKTKLDNRVRDSHVLMEGETKKINEVFLVGDSLMRFPRDASLGASPDEIVNCRCTMKYS